MEPRVQILILCRHHGALLLITGHEDSDHQCSAQTECSSCPLCQDSDCSTIWITLEQLISLLQAIQCPHTHTSFQGIYHFTEGDVWDDIVEVCDDCGARLE